MRFSYGETVEPSTGLRRDCQSPNPCLWNGDNAILRIIHISFVGQHGLKDFTENRTIQISRGSGIERQGVYKNRICFESGIINNIVILIRIIQTYRAAVSNPKMEKISL